MSLLAIITKPVLRMFRPPPRCDRSTPWCTVDHSSYPDSMAGNVPCNHCGRLRCCPKPKNLDLCDHGYYRWAACPTCSPNEDYQ